MKKYLTLFLLLPLFGCDPALQRKVDKYTTQLSVEIRMRGRLELAANLKQLEVWYNAKITELNTVELEALKAIYASGKLTPDAAKKNAGIFTQRRQYLENQMIAARAILHKNAEWFENAADLVDSIQEYNAAKDEAILYGAKAMLETFTKTYVANRGAPADENEAKAQNLMDQFTAELQTFLQARIGDPAIVGAKK